MFCVLVFIKKYNILYCVFFCLCHFLVLCRTDFQASGSYFPEVWYVHMQYVLKKDLTTATYVQLSCWKYSWEMWLYWHSIPHSQLKLKMLVNYLDDPTYIGQYCTIWWGTLLKNGVQSQLKKAKSWACSWENTADFSTFSTFLILDIRTIHVDFYVHLFVCLKTEKIPNTVFSVFNLPYLMTMTVQQWSWQQ